MQMRSCGVSSIPHPCDYIPGFYFLAYCYKNLGTVPVFCGKGMSLIRFSFNGNAQAVSARFAGHRNRTVMSGQDVRSLAHANIHAGMIIFLPADGMYPVAVIAGDIGQPVSPEYILHILAVAFGLQ